MDRNIRGIFAGFSGGIAMNLWGFFSYHILGLTELRFPDWSSILIFGKKSEDAIMLIFALFVQLLWCGFLGTIFAFLVPVISSKYYLIKGAFFGALISFFIYLAPAFFKMPQITKISLGAGITDIIGGIIWGVTTVSVLKYLDKRIKV